MFNSRSFSIFLQNMSFQNLSFSNIFLSFLNNEASCSFFNKCIYSYKKNHLYKKNCVKFNENLRIKRIHLQKKKNSFSFLWFWCFSRSNDVSQKSMTMRRECKKVYLFESRHRSCNKSSHRLLKKERRF
jgi:hypothetical protein